MSFSHPSGWKPGAIPGPVWGAFSSNSSRRFFTQFWATSYAHAGQRVAERWRGAPPRSLEFSSEQLFPVLPCPVNSHRLVLPESSLPSQLRKPTWLCPDPSPRATAWKLSQGVVCWDSGGLFSVSQKDLFLACLASHQTLFQTFWLFLLIVLNGKVSVAPVAPSCLEAEVQLLFFSSNRVIFLRQRIYYFGS